MLDSIRRFLTDAGVAFRELHHEATYTSEESARARGESLQVGAKALLVKGDDTFRLLVLPADRKLDSAAARSELGVRKIRFATAEELLELTGLVPGSVPPFGRPLLPFELYADTAIGSIEDKVAFNAGSLTDSIVMRATDWESVARPRRCTLAKLA